MTKQELREMLNSQVAEFLNAGGEVTKVKTAKYKNITWPLERHPWGLFNRGHQKGVMKMATDASAVYTK